ncbi:O-antigen ligase family protein [Yoonia sp.]|uniref:O-antigen ligase family protein n=1 Tax=Yoonia sp. TaxID=2212373 RepID=UPI002FD9BE0E
MFSSRPEDRYKLLTMLSVIILWFVPVSMFVTPIVDFVIVKWREINWTMTMTMGSFLFTTIPLMAIVKTQLFSNGERRFFWAILGFFGYALILSLIMSTDWFYPVYGLSSWLGAALAGTVIYVMVRDGVLTPERTFRILSYGLIFTALPMVLVLVDTDRFAEIVGWRGAANMLYAYENPRALGWISSIALSLLVIRLATSKEDDRFHPALLLLIIVASTTLFWSGSRGGLIALAVSFGAVLALSKTRNTKRLAIALACVAVGGVISVFLYLPSTSYGILPRIDAKLSQGNVDAMSSGRLTLWKLTMSFIVEQPLLGYGALPHKELPGFTHGSAHNIILDAWLWFGIPLGTFALGCGAYLWFRTCAIFRKADDPYLAAFFCVISTLAVYSLLSGPYARTFPVLLFAISAGVLLGSRRRTAKERA